MKTFTALLRTLPTDRGLDTVRVDSEGRLVFRNRVVTLRASNPTPGAVPHTQILVRDFLKTELAPAVPGDPFFFPIPKTSTQFTLTKQQLAKVASIASIAQHESPRQYASVVCFNTGGIVATDGFRLAHYRLALPVTKNLLLPVKTLRAVAKLKRQITVGVTEDNTTAVITCDDFTIYARISPVQYPRYEQIIPEKTGRVELNPAQTGLHLNPDFLADTLKIGAKNMVAYVNPNDREDIVLFDDGEIVQLIVPMREQQTA